MPLSKRVTMNAGGKVSLSRFDNNISSERLKQGSWIPDAGVAASNLLKENIGAVYASFVMKLPKSVSITAGLRYEYTHSRLTSTKSPIVTRKYGELFPTITISKIVNGENSVNFSYSRRITRPAFNDLAPFTIFFDPKTFFSGNPGLRPAIANTVQAGYTFGRYTFYVSYTHEDNTIDNFYFQTQRIDTASNILYLSARNFSYKEYLTVSGSLPFTVTHWWSMQNNISCNFRWISTAFDGAPVMLRNFDYSLLSAQHFILSGTFSAELTGTYTSATYPGTAKCRPLYQIDAGVQKKFASNKDILRLAINDMFNSGSHYRLEERLPSGAIVRRNFDFQLVSYRLTYTRNFGNNALKGKRERATGAEDELKRVQ
jgi:hypothetical protein